MDEASARCVSPDINEPAMGDAASCRTSRASVAARRSYLRVAGMVGATRNEVRHEKDLHFSGGGPSDGGTASVVRLKQGEGARRVWAYLAGKCSGKIESAQ